MNRHKLVLFFFLIAILNLNAQDSRSENLVTNYFNNGKECLRANRHNEALAWFQSALLHDPDNLASLVMAGNSCAGLELYASAIHYYTQAINSWDDDIAYNNLSIAYATLGYDDEALICIKGIDGSHSNKYLCIGGIAERHGDYDKAKKYMRLDMRRNAKSPVPYYNMGVISQDLNLLDSAVYYFGKTTEINPQYALAYVSKAQAMQLLGKPESEYKDLCLQAIKLTDKNSSGYPDISILADSYLLLNDKKNAEKYLNLKLQKLNKFIELYPASYPFLTDRGETYLSMGNKEAAAKDFRRSLEINPDYVWVRKKLNKLLSEE
ncbi:MAG: tetratricopeptide repeat protein [Dysgonomonas sp.]